MSFMTWWFCFSISWRMEGEKLNFTAMIDRAHAVPPKAGKYRVVSLPCLEWQGLDGAGRKTGLVPLASPNLQGCRSDGKDKKDQSGREKKRRLRKYILPIFPFMSEDLVSDPRVDNYQSDSDKASSLNFPTSHLSGRVPFCLDHEMAQNS